MENSRAIQPGILLLCIVAFSACSLLAGCYPMLITAPAIVVDENDEQEKQAKPGQEEDGKHSDEKDILKDWEKPIFT